LARDSTPTFLPMLPPVIAPEGLMSWPSSVTMRKA
jgi:hypothetical protein